MSDFFPLQEGALREYATENSRGAGILKVEVLSVIVAAGKTVAQCRRTVSEGGKPPVVTLYEVVKNAQEVCSGGATEFALPVKSGTEWIRSPRRYWIEALDAVVTTPAGTFKNCLRVAYLIAEGDGGSGERHYAPGVGLVKIVENDEAEPFTVALTSRRP